MQEGELWSLFDWSHTLLPQFLAFLHFYLSEKWSSPSLGKISFLSPELQKQSVKLVNSISNPDHKIHSTRPLSRQITRCAKFRIAENVIIVPSPPPPPHPPVNDNWQANSSRSLSSSLQIISYNNFNSKKLAFRTRRKEIAFQLNNNHHKLSKRQRKRSSRVQRKRNLRCLNNIFSYCKNSQ